MNLWPSCLHIPNSSDTSLNHQSPAINFFFLTKLLIVFCSLKRDTLEVLVCGVEKLEIIMKLCLGSQIRSVVKSSTRWNKVCLGQNFLALLKEWSPNSHCIKDEGIWTLKCWRDPVPKEIHQTCANSFHCRENPEIAMENSKFSSSHNNLEVWGNRTVCSKAHAPRGSVSKAIIHKKPSLATDRSPTLLTVQLSLAGWSFLLGDIQGCGWEKG